MEMKRYICDALIIGGGAAGCYAAISLSRLNPDMNILLVDKAPIERSGCLAAGVNALNAYITKGQTPQNYVDYAIKDGHGIVRPDLLLTMSERLNHVTQDMEQLGLVILKDEYGDYVARGNRNIKINGENIKPILAKAVRQAKNIQVLERVTMTDYMLEHNRVIGAVGINIEMDSLVEIHANATICCTGGASGLYRPNQPGSSRHTMWYSPFNTGAGYAMGLRAGAEMTTFEMRFVALRCKDTIAPTGTLAQGVGAEQVNALGEQYQYKYGNTTYERVYAVNAEVMAGHGPCYLQTTGIGQEAEDSLLKAYLNMAPMQSLKWMETGRGPNEQDVEIEGSEPYIVGGHTASGYWIHTDRSTTIPGLYAAGDVAGGAPQKYVTGCFSEGEIVAETVARDLAARGKEKGVLNQHSTQEQGSLQQGAEKKNLGDEVIAQQELSPEGAALYGECQRLLNTKNAGLYSIDELEEAMQTAMDAHAGGIGTVYRYTERSLDMALREIDGIESLLNQVGAEDMYGVMKYMELKDRLLVCKTLIAHLKARKETRWPGYGEYVEYPELNDEFNCYINSVYRDGDIAILKRPLVEANGQLSARGVDQLSVIGVNHPSVKGGI
ncbi:MAG: adenylyl-sulfate reductase subunit alpha [Negativicutes bacterium]|jgi:adenylylsulfate reductase subunit A|nr:adenylyl-sulfate reductase subunit alpha [Negativicutes bacterium]